MVAENLSPGTQLGGFRLESVIHAGGMAVIWKVSRDGVSMPMAMKIPLLKDADDPSYILCFEVEEMILPKISSVHAPRFIEAEDFSTRPFLVMELVEGQSLEQMLKGPPLAPEKTAEIGLKVAKALADLHSQNVIHLDLTPDNIMFRENGEAVLIDFGLSRHFDLPDLMGEEFSQPMGTAPYISPEQVLNVRSNPASDIFSLGVVMYQAVTGELPFGDPKSVGGLRRRLYALPLPPRAINKDCPQWLQEIILKCLEPDPKDRYASADELARILENPTQVTLTHRARRMKGVGVFAYLKRWLDHYGAMRPMAESADVQIETPPVILAAVDVTDGAEPLSTALRQAVKRAMNAEKGARLTCVAVRKIPAVGLDLGVDKFGRNLRLQYLIKLKRWAQPLGIPEDNISFHVLEAPDVANAIVNYATTNHVDYIVIGARGSSTLRRFLGSVSSHVVAEAPCSVKVVRINPKVG